MQLLKRSWSKSLIVGIAAVVAAPVAAPVAVNAQDVVEDVEVHLEFDHGEDPEIEVRRTKRSAQPRLDRERREERRVENITKGQTKSSLRSQQTKVDIANERSWLRSAR